MTRCNWRDKNSINQNFGFELPVCIAEFIKTNKVFYSILRKTKVFRHLALPTFNSYLFNEIRLLSKNLAGLKLYLKHNVNIYSPINPVIVQSKNY